MYNPRNVTYKSTTHVYFLTTITGRATGNLVSEEKNRNLKINAKTKAILLFIISVRRADGSGNICPDLAAKTWKNTYIAVIYGNLD